MKKIVKTFEKIISDIEGKLVWIGLNNEFLINKISGNKNIFYCDLLNSLETSKTIGKGKRKKQTLGVKDFRKFYKKKNIDYLIADIKDIEKLLPRFIPNSVYICSKYVYIYGHDEDYERIIKRYKRYSKNIKIEKYNDEFLIKVDVSCSKNNFFKDKIYFVCDVVAGIIDLISDLIVS